MSSYAKSSSGSLMTPLVTLSLSTLWWITQAYTNLVLGTWEWPAFW